MFNGHKNVMLQFSGGKDSLACLWMLEMHWPDMIVAWVNTGDAFPETLKQMEVVKGLVPHFMEIRSDQPAQIARAGYPVDLLPVWDTELGRLVDTTRSNRYQTPFSCCSANIWIPLANAVKDCNVTLVIRGQRNDETKKSPIRSGHTEDGVQYWFPIEDWTDKQVAEFLGDRLPTYYPFLNTSLDCQHCTAYLNENRRKLEYVKKTHMSVANELEYRLLKIRADCMAELGHVNAALEA